MTNPKLYSEIRRGYKEYLEYIQDNPRVILPQHIHDPAQSIGKVHASALGRCPKATAMKRKVKQNAETLETLHLMQQGVRDAEPLQEAMLWYHPATQVEFSVEREHFRGRCDILYKGKHIIEIKRRDGYMKANPQPKLTDAYQLIAYSYITGIESIHLCLMTRFGLFFWSLQPVEKGFRLYDEEGNEWKNGYNNPSYLNYNVIFHEAQRHLEYLNEVRVEDPLPNFLNIPAGSECGHWEGKDRPKKYKVPYGGETERLANFIPHCPFFAECKGIKGDLISVEEVAYGSSEYRINQAG